MKMWKGRFTKHTDKLTEEFNSSISTDSRMLEPDIAGSIAHAEMIAKQGIISFRERDLIIKGLNEILADLKEDKLKLSVEAEDIHMNIETLLTAKIGEAGKKLHTARSRNDQVALDIRLYLRDEAGIIQQLLLELLDTILFLASDHIDTIMPGYTHMQKAQPVTLAHHLMAYFEMLRRDAGRLEDCLKRLNWMPLGSGALAATGFNIDRNYVKERLNFQHITANSMDAVSDRDFAVEFCSFASILMMHLSRFSEELILWSSEEFSYVKMDDAFSTGSSIMPQKKNPDIAELVRGKTGRVYGDLVSLLTIMKGLPLAYNKDMQEDKGALFDAVDTVKECLKVYRPMLATLEFNKDIMNRAARGGFTNATDFADYLAIKGIPFRDAHEIVGKAVLYCIEHKITLNELSLEKYREFSPVIEGDIYQYIDIVNCVARRLIPGGPAPETVKKAINEAATWLQHIGNKCSPVDK